MKITFIHIIIIIVISLIAKPVNSLNATKEMQDFLIVDNQVKHIDSSEFSTIINKGIYFIFFGATWCRHCRQLTPIWKQLEDETTKVQLRKVECTRNKELCDKNKVDSYPALNLYFDGVLIKQYPDTNPNTLVEFKSFLDKELIVYQLSVKAEEIHLKSLAQSGKHVVLEGVGVHELDGRDYEGGLKGDWIIMYHAPWCSHCKELSPVFTDVALRLNGKVNVGKVDCTANPKICQQMSVKGYPTVIYTSNLNSLEYTGSRSLESIVQFSLSESKYIIKAIHFNRNRKVAFQVITGEEYLKMSREMDVFYLYAYTVRNEYRLNLVIEAARRETGLLFICPYESCLEPGKEEQLFSIKDTGLEKVSFSFETGKIDDWFQQNKFSFIPELTPSTSTQLFKARILVLGVTRSTVPHLTLLKRQKLNDAEYAFIGKDYAEYLKRVYSVGIEERIFIIRSSDDMFWTEKTGSYPEWIASIDQGLPGKSSVGYLMRGVRSAGKVYDDIKQVEGLNLIIMVGVGILGFVYVVYKFMIKRKDDDGYEKAD